jgi:hypothetical protein
VNWYRKKPVEVAGVLYTGHNANEVKSFVGERKAGEPRFLLPSEATDVSPRAIVWNDSQNSWNPVNVGDTILRGLVGEYYPCSADALAATYDEVT